MNTFRTRFAFFSFILLSTPCFPTYGEKKTFEEAIEKARQYISQKKNEQNDKVQNDSSHQEGTLRLNIKRMEEEDWIFESIQNSLRNITDINGLIKLLENTNKIALSHIEELEFVLKESQDNYEYSYSFLRRIVMHWQHINFFCLRAIEGFSKNENSSSTKNVDEHHQSTQSFRSQKERARYANSLRNSTDSERSKNKSVRSPSSAVKSSKMSEAEKIDEAIKKELFGTSSLSRKTKMGEFDSNPQERENNLPVIYAPAILAEDESFNEKGTESINEVKTTPPPIPLRRDLINGMAIETVPLSSKKTTQTPLIPPRKDIGINNSNSQKKN